MRDSNFDGLLDPDAGWPDIPQASTQFVVLGGPGGPLNEQAKKLAARTKKLKADLENISGGGFSGQYKNLVVTVSGVGYQGTITADRLVVESATYKVKVLENINVAFNGANNGANGIDTGSMVAGNWYNLYVIYNPVTDSVASIISLSATPLLPTGYTNFACIGAAYIPVSTSAFLASKKRDKTVSYADITGFVQLLNNATLNNSTLSVSTATATPPRATKISISCVCGGSNYSLYGDPNNTVPYITAIAGSGYASVTMPFKVNSNITVKTSVSATGINVYCTGYEDSI